MKEFVDFRLFKKVVRKYWKRHASKKKYYSKSLNRNITCWWTNKIWCYYILQDISELNDPIKKKHLYMDMDECDIPKFIESHKHIIGHTVNVTNNKNEYITSGYLFGIALANNGCYYIIDNKDGRFIYSLSVKINV